MFCFVDCNLFVEHTSPYTFLYDTRFFQVIVVCNIKFIFTSSLTWSFNNNKNQLRKLVQHVHHVFLSLRIHVTGILTYIYHKNQPNVGKYTIHGSSGYRCWYVFFWGTFDSTCFRVKTPLPFHPSRMHPSRIGWSWRCIGVIPKGFVLGCGPLTVTVTTRIITFFVGDPYKPSFTTVTVRGPYPRLFPVIEQLGGFLGFYGYQPPGNLVHG